MSSGACSNSVASGGESPDPTIAPLMSKPSMALAINADGTQRPSQIKQRPPREIVQALKRCRAGIEPLTQHASPSAWGEAP